MRILNLTVAVAALCAAGPAAAFDKAEELVEVLKLRDSIDQMFEGMAPLIAGATLAELANMKSTVISGLIENGRGGRERLTAIMSEEILGELRNNYPEFLAAVAQQYRTGMSDSELEATLIFYRSPAGAKLLAQQKTMETEMGKVGERIGMKAGATAIPRALERAEAEMSR